MMNILLLGKNGQVGWELQRSLSPLGIVTALDRQGGRTADGQLLCGDLNDLDGLASTVHTLRPDVIVNAAAHTAVYKAASEPELARRLNAQAPSVLAREAAALGAWLVLYYSTDDYVLPWLETDIADPIVINDQFGVPTEADLIADVTAHAIHHISFQARTSDGADGTVGLSGVNHLVASGTTTWFDYANHVLGLDDQGKFTPGLAVKEVVPVPSSDFATVAKRPLNSRLNADKLQQTFKPTLPSWQQGVDHMLAEIN